MSKAIYKYILEVTDYQEIDLPINSKILTIQTQFTENYSPLDNEVPVLWALVDEYESEREVISLRTFGTGHPIYEESEIQEYLGTYQLKYRGLVFHIFKL